MGPLILASSSPFRRRMLKDAGLLAAGEAPGVDESAPASITDAADLAQHLAQRKAAAVRARHPDAVVIGADQVAFLPDDPGHAIGKPADAAAHLAMLQHLRGRAHVLVTGLCVLAPGIEHLSRHRTIMHVRSSVTDEELAAYVATEEGRHCAAGYAAEGKGAFLFERIEGDFFNVLGLPLLSLIEVLRGLGWRFGEQ